MRYVDSLKSMDRLGSLTKKDKISFSSLARQIQIGLTQGYVESEIVDGVIRSITPGLVLRSYLETYKELTLDRLKRILHSHYGVKNMPELYQTLASLGQSQKESPQGFLMKALDLRQQILFASSDESDDRHLQYDFEHIQRLFLRSVEAGLQDESIRAKIRPFLKDPNVADEVLMQQMGVAVSAEKERGKKLRGNKPRSPLATVALVSDSSNEKKSKQEPSQQSNLMAATNAIKSEVEALKGEVRRKDVDKTGSGLERNRPPRCSSCVGKKEEYCNHCFKCGSESHFARGCRKSLNGRRLPHHCNHCFRVGGPEQFKRCKQCKSVLYCSMECQKAQ